MSGQGTFSALADHLNNRFLEYFGAEFGMWSLALDLLSITLWIPSDKAQPLLDGFNRMAAANQRAQAFYQGVDEIYNQLVSNRRWDGKTFVEKAKAVRPESYYTLATELERRVAEVKLDSLERQLRWEALRAFLKFPGPQDKAIPRDGAKREAAVPTKIPAHKRTKPLCLKSAAQWMGYGYHSQAVKKLRAAMKAGAVRYEKRTRQQYVFSRDDFPKESWPQVIPTESKSS
jgi:hypothetical protein